MAGSARPSPSGSPWKARTYVVVVADVDEDRAQATTSGITEDGDRAETLAFDLVYPKACAEAVAGVVARRAGWTCWLTTQW